jgi:kynurenine formamidase
VPRFIDLSHTFEDGMPGFRMRDPDDGSIIEYSAHIYPFLTHEQSRKYYDGKAEFEVTMIYFHTSTGTYLDSPYHRWKDRRDISQLALQEVILPGVVIDARGLQPWQALGAKSLQGIDVERKAVLINFGWDRYWGTEDYYAYPFLSQGAILHLAEAGAKLVGVDTINIDSSREVHRPAHSVLLKLDTLIVENLTNLDALHGNHFRFFAVPIKAAHTAAMPIRAFAEVE